VRANEQLGLTAMHTLFMREHNLQAKRLRRGHGNWSGDRIYDTARAIVGAEIQVITYNEFLPMLLGADALPPYSGYKPEVNPGIDNAFSAAAYRLGHTLLTPELLRLKHNGRPIPRGNLALRDAFFVPAELHAGQGIEPLLRGLAMNQAQEVDPFIVDEVRNFLFGPPGSGGFDLASLNIQRGRDHGLPRYNAMRVSMGLAAKTSFADVSSDPVVQARLASVYASVDDIDLWVGGLCEDHVPGAMLGELLRSILVDQFTRLRDGDRFWYENHFSDSMVQELEQTTLARIIRRNTSIGKEIPDNVFEITPVALAVVDRVDHPTIGRSDAAPGDAILLTGDENSPIDETTGGRATEQRGGVFPNPARRHATVQLATSRGNATEAAATAHVAIYDARGRLVRTLQQQTGAGTWRWNLRTTAGTRVPRGTYFIRVQTAQETTSHKLLVVD
jgi:hypothetical protein